MNVTRNIVNIVYANATFIHCHFIVMNIFTSKQGSNSYTFLLEEKFFFGFAVRKWRLLSYRQTRKFHFVYNANLQSYWCFGERWEKVLAFFYCSFFNYGVFSTSSNLDKNEKAIICALFQSQLWAILGKKLAHFIIF